MRPRRPGAALLAALLILHLVPRTALAQDVTLSSRDGSLTLEGTLLGFDGEFYRVETIYGPLTIDGLGVSCTGPGCPNLEAYVAALTLSGSEAMGAVLMPAMIEAFAAQRGLAAARAVRDALGFSYTLSDTGGRPLAEIDFRLTTTDEGFADLLAGEADMVMASREVTAAEIALGREAGIGTLSAPGQSRIVALDALVAVVAPGNPVQTVAPERLAQVLSGGLSEWEALGGPEGQRVRLHALDPRLGVQQAVAAALLSPAGATLSPDAVLHDDAGALADAVAGDPLAIGVTLRSSLGSARGLGLIGGCGFVLGASDPYIRSEDYPLVAPQFLYLPNRRLPAIARDFLSFLSSPTAQRVAQRAGFVDLGIRRVPLAQQGDRLANAVLAAGPEVTLPALQDMVATLAGAERLSPTFRFRTGAAGLDASSRGNALLLAEALEAGVYDGRELIFAGFSDSEGSAEANLRIARSRAETVLGAVRALAETADFGRIALRAEAFGEALPMACDDSDWGRRVNRRVEVWLR
jgi:phosphate transport system substrate-binding protein